ncbi:hypothetical protein TEA_011099 [Camellia sinensis var. sinensis]|uniref:G-patch domain-containing protein n=1 Tax=Camellia sinensis var. sinensis TaxID=542762 RepID=A0A4S4DTX2_CAMSN|nr:hypothetical protein TEA_011099 [Camellia sinensis var. sinensis]
MCKERVRWGDPMAHLVKKKYPELVLSDLGDDDKMKESGFIVPQGIPSHSWLKRGLDAPPNRYIVFDYASTAVVVKGLLQKTTEEDLSQILCNEPRTADALPADVASSNPTTVGKKGEAGPTHVFVVRGLDENANEEMLCYECSKHAPIKRSHEGQAPRVALDYNQPSASAEDKSNSVGASTRSRYKMEAVITKENITTSSGFTTARSTTAAQYPGTLVGASSSSSAAPAAAYPAGSSSMNADAPKTVTPFRIDASALGSYTPPVTSGSGKGRFSEMPVQSASTHKEQSQTTYQDWAAERRSLYGSTSSIGDDVSDLGIGDSMKYASYKSDGETLLCQGLGKDESGMVEPVQAQAMEKRAGLGSQQKKLDPNLGVQAGDKYKLLFKDLILQVVFLLLMRRLLWQKGVWRESTNRTFVRRTSSVQSVNYWRELNDLDSEIGDSEYMDYTMHIPPTLDHQPMDPSISQRRKTFSG